MHRLGDRGSPQKEVGVVPTLGVVTQGVAAQGVVTQGKEKKGGDRDNNVALSLLETAAAADKAKAAAEEEEVITLVHTMNILAVVIFMNDGLKRVYLIDCFISYD